MTLASVTLLAIEIKPVREPRADPFELRWQNWVRWCNQKGLHQGRVGSLEGAYRSPQIWHPPEPRPPTIDVVDAILVNRAYTKLAQDAHSAARIIKILVFRPYWRPQYQAQKLGIHYTTLDDALIKSKQMLCNVLKTC